MQLFYRKFGNEGNPPLIILHGLFGISDNWVTFGKRMAEEGFEVFIPDQRNHGRSEWSDDFNYLALTNDLYDFIDAEEIENPVLLGHSMGGKVAMRFAVSYPNLVQKLIIVDMAPKPYDVKQQHLNMIRAMLDLDLTKIESRTEAEQQLATTVTDQRIRQFILKNLYRKDKNTFGWRLNLTAIARNLQGMSDTIPEESRYAKPVLFIKGALSDYILPEDTALILHHFPQAEIVTISGASHWVHADAPEEFYRHITRFLSGNSTQKNTEHDDQPA
jgi:pimeloyl-ACP methyl ester carboxylesterase